MNKLGPQAFALAATALIALPAFGQTLRSPSVDPLQAAYLKAEAVQGTGAVVKAADIAQVRWDRVVFRNDSARGLVHVQLWTRAETYAQLKARLGNPNDALWDLLDNGGVQNASAGGQDMMICNHGASGVVLSFDRPMAKASPVQIAAAQPDADDMEIDVG